MGMRLEAPHATSTPHLHTGLQAHADDGWLENVCSMRMDVLSWLTASAFVAKNDRAACR